MPSLKLNTRVLLGLFLCLALAFGAKLYWGTTQSLAGRGVFVTPLGSETAQFVPWTGEASIQEQLEALRDAGGGELVFAPGDYELQAGFHLVKINNLRIAGTRATRLHFAPEPAVRPSLLVGATRRDRTLRVANPETMRVGRSYQLYKKNLKGDRILEFKVKQIEGETVHLAVEVSLMGHVKEIPAGSVVVDEINAFHIVECNNLVIEGLEVDGINRGDVHGHTTYCGVYAKGKGRPKELPETSGLTVRGCHIHGMKGRGVCVYSMKDVLIEGNEVHDIDSQAIEIDHFAQGVVRCNLIGDATVGVALNDAFDSIVEMNTIDGCVLGVHMMQHFDVAPFNQGNVVKANIFIGCRDGIYVPKGIKNNTFTDNSFIGLDEWRWVKQEGGNVSERNVGLDK